MRDSVVRIVRGLLWSYVVVLIIASGATTLWLMTDFVVESRIVGVSWIAVAAYGVIVLGGLAFSHSLYR